MISPRVVAHCDVPGCARETEAVATQAHPHYRWTRLDFPSTPDGTPSSWVFEPMFEVVLCPGHAKEASK